MFGESEKSAGELLNSCQRQSFDEFFELGLIFQVMRDFHFFIMNFSFEVSNGPGIKQKIEKKCKRRLTITILTGA